jgi:hypothetical protein
MDPVNFFRDGWEGAYQVLSPGGLTLTDLRHDGYNLGPLIRVSRICINPAADDKTDSRILKLGTSAIDVVPGSDAVSVLGLSDSPPFQFSSYKSTFGLKSRFQTAVEPGPTDLFNDPANALRITQRYLFTTYGTNPPHEPSGYLPACRLFPLVQFSTSNPRINSIRIDYLIRFRLDSLLRPENFSRPSFWLAAQGPNQAGVFRDIDHIALMSTVRAALTGGPAMTSDFFTAAEKPLQYEILSLGLKEGQSQVSGKIIGWDNMHQWGASGTLPSTPGAFHAAHLHWRWGDLVTKPSFTDNKIQEQGVAMGKVTKPKALGSPVFAGVPQASGGLVDPTFPHQTIRFAIINTRRIPAIDGNTTEYDFDKLIKSAVGKYPKYIKNGDDLCLWLSFEVPIPKGSTPPFTATVFPHGLFFAHNPENLTLKPTSDTLDQASPHDPLPEPVPLVRSPSDPPYR